MGWWILGGAIGYMLGGPLGGLIGAYLLADKKPKRFHQTNSHQLDQQQTQAAFFAATFSVMGYIAKMDGQVSASEVNMAKRVMEEMQLDQQQRVAAIGLFNEGKKNDFPLHEVLEQFRNKCGRRSRLIRMFLQIQISAALADGRLDASEKDALYTIAQQLGIQQQIFEELLNSALHQMGSHHDPEDDHKTLGIEATASDAELKRAYRRLMQQNHPDKLVSQGLPEEMLRVATEKTQGIKSAYERIKESRRTH